MPAGRRSAPPANPNHPWDRQHGETPLAHHAARAYFELDPQNRSLERVRQMLGKTPGYQRNLERWSSNHTWVERAAAWDQHLHEQAQDHALEEEKERLRVIVAQHRDTFDIMLQALIVPHREITERLARRDQRTIDELAALPLHMLYELAKGANRGIVDAVRGARLTRGLPDWKPPPAEEEAHGAELRIILSDGKIQEPPTEQAPRPRKSEAAKPSEDAP